MTSMTKSETSKEESTYWKILTEARFKGHGWMPRLERNKSRNLPLYVRRLMSGLSGQEVARRAGIHFVDYYKLEAEQEYKPTKLTVRFHSFMQRLADFWMCDVEELFPVEAVRLEARRCTRMAVAGDLSDWYVSEYTRDAARSPADLYDSVELRRGVRHALNLLDAKARWIIRNHYGFRQELSLETIATLFGVTGQAVGQLYRDRIARVLLPKTRHLRVLLKGGADA